MKKNMITVTLIVCALVCAYQNIYSQTPESLDFSCPIPEISSLSIHETLNPDNQIVVPPSTKLIICNSDGLDVINLGFDIDLNCGSYDDPSLAWQMVNANGESISHGNFISHPVNYDLSMSNGNSFILRVGVDENSDGMLLDMEIQLKVDIFVLEVEILAGTEERSFFPSVFDNSGISEIEIDVKPSIFDTGGSLNWSWEHQEDTTPDDPWDDHTGQVEFQEESTNQWGDWIVGGVSENALIRAKVPGIANLEVTYQVNSNECSSIKPISVPQFLELNYTGFDDDLGEVGLRRFAEDIGNEATQITSERNEIVKQKVIESLIFGMEECYNNINVRIVTEIPSFLLPENYAIANIGGSYPFPVSGFASNDPNTSCTTGSPDEIDDLDLGNKIATGLGCIFSKTLATTSTLDAGHANTFDPVIMEPISNFHFNGNNEILNDLILDAIDKFGMLIGSTIAHEFAHLLGLVPDTRHNANELGEAIDTGGVMDDGFLRDWLDRVDLYYFNENNEALLISILPTEFE